MPYRKIGFTDIDGILRGKYLSEKKFNKSNHIEFCDVVFGWDMHDHCYAKDSVTGWYRGFPDGLLTIDKSTETKISYDNDTPFYFADFSEDPILKNVCPRSLVKSVLKEYHALNIYPKVGFEYEWFNFKRTASTLSKPEENTITNDMFGYSLARLNSQQPYVQDLLKYLKALNINIEGLHTETGPGVYEVAIQHTDALAAADKAILLKNTVKEIAQQHDIIASFMAKWNSNLPGCGGHIHLSLEDKNGKQLFDFKEKETSNTLSNQFLAGTLAGAIPLFSLYAPNINSYKRFQKNSWAATAVNWGFQNRTTAVRIIPSKVADCHLEMRLPGADTNPYLALYALLVSGLYGVKEKLDLQLKPTKGNAYEDHSTKKLPTHLAEAIEVLEKSEMAKKVLNVDFLNHFSMTRKWEVEQYKKAVTDWEIKRYLEII